MATTPEANPPAEAPASPKEKRQKQAVCGQTCDFAGIGLAIAGIIGGLLLEKGSIQDVAQGTAAMIVVGGTLGAVLVTTPVVHVLRAFGTGLGLLRNRKRYGVYHRRLIQYATKARKEGS